MPEETQLQGAERINLLIPRRARTGRRSKVSSPLFCTSALLGAQPDAPNCPSSRFPCPVPAREVAGSQPCAGRTLRDSRLFPAPSLPIPPGTPSRALARPRAAARPFCRRCRGRDNISATVNLQQKGCPSLRRMFKDRGLN